MPIIELLVTSVGYSVGKALFEGWIRASLDDGSAETAAVAIAGSLFNYFHRRTDDYLTAQDAKNQLEQVATTVARSLQPIVDSNTQLGDASKEIVIKAVGQAIRGYNAQMLFEKNLGVAELAHSFNSNNPQLSSYFDTAEKMLYQRLLSEAANLLVRMGSKLPDFEVEAFKKVIAQQNRILMWLNEVLEEVRKINQATQNPNQRSAAFETAYRNEIATGLNKIDHLGLGSIGIEAQHAPLDIAYVSLKAHRRKHRGWREESFSREEPKGIEEILADTKYLLIRGVAGCGKTTLLRWLAVKIAGGGLPDALLWAWLKKVPFYIKLRDYAEKDLPKPEQFLDIVAENMEGAPEAWVHQCLREARAVILVDGVDELPETRRHEVREKINGWQKSFPNVPIIVTSRPIEDVKEDWLYEQAFDSADVLPLESDKVAQFVSCWHDALAARKPELKPELDKLAQNLIGAIHDDATLRDLATTPLLLSALCAIHKNSRQHLPKNRTELYKQLINMLLDRDNERDITDVVDKDTKLYYLKKLALRLVRSNKTITDKELVINIIRNNPKPGSTPMQDEIVYKSLVVRSGIVREPAVGKVDYIHRTLQEYLAASEAIYDNGWDELIVNAHNDHWHRVIEFSGGISAEMGDFQQRLIDGLHSQKQYLLALNSVRGAITYKSKDAVSRCAEEAVKRLIKPVEVSSISAAGSLALPYLHCELHYGGWHLGLRIKVLAAIEGSYDVLLTYRGNGKLGVIKALVNEAARTFGLKRIIKDFIEPLGLTELRLENPDTLEGLELLPKLQTLEIIGSTSDIDIEQFSHITHLQKLVIANTSRIKNLNSIANFKLLDTLHLLNLSEIIDVDFLTNCENIKHLVISELPNLRSLQSIATLRQLHSLNLYYLPEIDNLNFVATLDQLQDLTLTSLPQIYDLEFVAELKQLSSLGVSHLNHLSDFSFLGKIKPLKRLKLFELHNIDDLSFLNTHRNLEYLSLYELPQVNDFNFLQEHEQLQHLDLSNIPEIVDLDFLGNFNQLYSLDLFGLEIENVSFLVKQMKLHALDLFSLELVTDLEPLGELKNLKTLHIAFMTEECSFEFLTKLEQIETLKLHAIPRIKNLQFLANLRNLKVLHSDSWLIEEGAELLLQLPELDVIEIVSK